MDMYRKFTETLRVLDPRGGVIVAFSGGADSVCLLHLFCTAAMRGDFPYPLAAAHLNHSLRGEEAVRDARFCEAFCRARGIPFFCETADVTAAAKAARQGIEEAAREVRYAFFDRLLDTQRAYTHVATAHNKNDLCETMLFNLSRGTGLCGLCSIPARRGNILRPLLNVSRAEILSYIEANDLDFVTDSTNLSAAYSRNRIRQDVLPALTAVSPHAVDSMARAAHLLRTDADYLNTEAQKLLPELVTHGALDTEKAQKIHTALLSRVLRMLYNDTCGIIPDAMHMDALCAKIASGNRNFRQSMPGAEAICSHGLLRFGTLPDGAAFCLPLRVDTPVHLPTGETLLLTRGAPPAGFPEEPAAVFATAALAGANLVVRSRKDGDTIVYFGKTHKAKRVIADAKLSPGEKARLFFLASGDTLLYIRALATADAAFCRGGDAMRLYIQTEENKGDAAGV